MFQKNKILEIFWYNELKLTTILQINVIGRNDQIFHSILQCESPSKISSASASTAAAATAW